MLNIYAIRCVAWYEAKLLFRSWAFRIFSILGIVILFGICVGMGTKIGGMPHFMRALGGSLLLANLKMLNIYQGIIAAFMATEFLKRDRKHDTSQVIFTRSFSNIDYLLGKFLGIIGVFSALNAVIVLMTFFFDAFLSQAAFAWEPYFWFPLLVSLPTLIFVIGGSVLLVTLFRSQAVVFVAMLGFSLLSLIYLGRHFFFIFDAYMLYQPLVFSGFVGLGNWTDLFLLRGAYFILGLGMFFISVFMTKRLKQSNFANAAALVISIVCLVSSVLLGTTYLNSNYQSREYRQNLKLLSQSAPNTSTVSILENSLEIDWNGSIVSGQSTLRAANKNESSMDSLLFSLNPGLKVASISISGEEIEFSQDRFLIWAKPNMPLDLGETISVEIEYSGTIDDRYCYLDLPNDKLESEYSLWLFRIPKYYSFVTDRYLHLTPESGWYPVAGLQPGTAFPNSPARDFTKFNLSVSTPPGLTAISQGKVSTEEKNGRTDYSFTPVKLLPQISLTVGEYERRSLTVEDVEYSLYTLPGHDYYMEYFDQLSDTMATLITELKNEYEVHLGLEYPYEKFSLVEAPIQFYAYNRYWTIGQETVQPQVVYLTEMGTANSGCDFRMMRRSTTRSQERANQLEDPKVIQATYLNYFAKIDLLGFLEGMRGLARHENVDIRFRILPNFISFMTNIHSDKWPLLNYAFESYFENRIKPPSQTRWRSWRGLTEQERANLALKEFSLNELISTSDVKDETVHAAVKSKGLSLLSLLEARSVNDEFTNEINNFVKANSFQNVTDSGLLAFASEAGSPDFSSDIETWYRDTTLAGYIFEDIESYNIIHDERTKTQVKFKVTNPTDVDGLIKISLRYQRQEANFGPWWARMQQQYDYSQMYYIPAQTLREIGFIIDQPPSSMTIDTYVSRNIPAILNHPFRDQQMRRKEAPVEKDSLMILVDNDSDSDGDYLVDNEDPGFTIIGIIPENWLRRNLRELFDIGEIEDPYVGIRSWDAPGIWLPTTGQKFHGKFIKSAMHKKSGTGENKIAWEIDLDASGDFDVYFYFEDESYERWWGHRNRNRNRDMGEKQFFVYHEDGVDKILLDLDDAEEGWNYLGTYRLPAGSNKIEMTDKNRTQVVTADAIKWVKR
ncbi:MAG: hypothetical protein V3V99_04415 [candidate division Zixibacteria bacterium]